MFKRFFEKIEERKDRINEAKEGYISWLEISNSKGWKIYEFEVNKKIENVRKQLENNVDLTGEDLKRLQLALQVWKEVQRIPKQLEEKAKGA